MSGYRVIKQLGHGGGGVVYLSWHQNLGKYVALKQMDVGAASMEQVRNEVDLLKNLRHSYLPQVYDFFQSGNACYLVEEYIEGEDLDHMLRRGCTFSEAQLVYWLNQLCQVLQYLHTRKPPIIHSDIKPANIMIDPQGNVCLIDFNIAICGAQKGLIRGYSRYYAPPEQIALTQAYMEGEDTETLSLNESSDLYSLAATFYSLITGKIPNSGDGLPLAQHEGLPYSEGLLRLLDRAMNPHQNRRWKSAKEMERALRRLEKLEERYKTYWRLRMAVSLCGMLLTSLGMVMLLQGVNEAHLSEYRKAYSSIENTYEQYGATDALAEEIQTVIDNGQFDQIRQNRKVETAQLYAIEGEYYFNLDNEAGYRNAANHFREAMELAPEGDKQREYAQNCAVALILSGESAEAERIADAYLEDRQMDTIRMQLYYTQNQDELVLSLAEELYETAGADRDVEIGYEIASRSAQRLGRWTAAVSWQKRALDSEPGDNARRKLARVCLKAGAAEGDEAYWREASRLYGEINLMSTEDQVNCALAEYELSHYQASLAMLKEAESTASHQSALWCRCKFYTALNCAATGDTDRAIRNCKAAVEALAQLSEQQRQLVDREGLMMLAGQLGVDGRSNGN